MDNMGTSVNVGWFAETDSPSADYVARLCGLRQLDVQVHPLVGIHRELLQIQSLILNAKQGSIGYHV